MKKYYETGCTMVEVEVGLGWKYRIVFWLGYIAQVLLLLVVEYL